MRCLLLIYRSICIYIIDLWYGTRRFRPTRWIGKRRRCSAVRCGSGQYRPVPAALMGTEAPKVPVLGQQRMAGEEEGKSKRLTRGSLSPTLSGWGSLSAYTEPVDVCSTGGELEVAASASTNSKRHVAAPAAGTSPRKAGGRDPRHGQTTSHGRPSEPESTLSLGVPAEDQNLSKVSTKDDKCAELEQRARHHKKELRLARQRRQRKPLSRPSATIPSPRLSLSVLTTEDPDVAAVRSSGTPISGAAVGRAKKGPPQVVWVDGCAGLAQGACEGVAAIHSALGRVGLGVRNYTDPAAALRWTANHKSQVACAVLRIQLAECYGADKELIAQYTRLNIPTVVLQFVPAGFDPSDAMKKAMEERVALCHKLGVPIASELTKVQAAVLEELSRRYEFGVNGELELLPAKTKHMPPWRRPRTDKSDKMPPVNGAASATLRHQPHPKRARRRGKKDHYHLAPSHRGAGTVRDNARAHTFVLRCLCADLSPLPPPLLPQLLLLSLQSLHRLLAIASSTADRWSILIQSFARSTCDMSRWSSDDHKHGTRAHKLSQRTTEASRLGQSHQSLRCHRACAWVQCGWHCLHPYRTMSLHFHLRGAVMSRRVADVASTQTRTHKVQG